MLPLRCRCPCVCVFGSHHTTHTLSHMHNRASDVLFGVIKSLTRRRKDLKVIVMSATLDVASFLRFFEDSVCVNVPGRQFPGVWCGAVQCTSQAAVLWSVRVVWCVPARGSVGCRRCCSLMHPCNATSHTARHAGAPTPPPPYYTTPHYTPLHSAMPHHATRHDTALHITRATLHHTALCNIGTPQ